MGRNVNAVDVAAYVILQLLSDPGIRSSFSSGSRPMICEVGLASSTPVFHR